ncbi:MAG: hypothetical protein R3E86_04265 [Pseudomonadales bacterium]
MSRIRDSVKDQLPAVMLTLLSIVQALALEMLWTRLHEVDALYQPGWPAATLWAQMAANFGGIIVIWVVYVSTVMRFRWVPAISDSVYPFFIGIGELVLIETSGPELVGVWFLIMALIFAVMNWVSHHTLRRARLEPENEWFFRHVGPARFRDFRAAAAIVAVLSGYGVGALLLDAPAVVNLAAVLAVNALLLRQLFEASAFWERSVQSVD